MKNIILTNIKNNNSFYPIVNCGQKYFENKSSKKSDKDFDY